MDQRLVGSKAQFCKEILQVRATPPSYMIYGELGCYPLSIKIKLRMTSFWNLLCFVIPSSGFNAMFQV
jgi:hypothetical protein